MFLRQTYDPFGNSTKIRSPLTVDIDDLNRYTYNGEDYDYNTGLQYLRSRYYSTSTGNFISQDTYLGDVITPLSQNRYTYCHNNPVMNDDPSGHDIFVVSGGKYDQGNNKRDGQYQFINSALGKIQSINDTDEKIVFMIADTGFSQSEKCLIKTEYSVLTGQSCENVFFFTNVDTLVDEINRREESVEEEKITSFYSYSHGIYFHNNGSVAYGYHAERELDRKLQL